MKNRPVWEYPCVWEYRLIGPSAQGLKSAAAHCLGDLQYNLQDGQKSRHGNYVSVHLWARVPDEATRDEIYQLLRHQDAVKMVL